MTGSASLIKLNDSKVSFVALVEGNALHQLNRAGRICSWVKEKIFSPNLVYERSVLGCEGV